MLKQLIRYGIVGVANNLVGYLVYLLFTWLWLDPKVAITLLYPVAALTAYFGHSKYSFLHKGRHSDAMPRYVIAHIIAYLTNLIILYVFVDKLSFPHQFIQFLAMFVVAGVLFLQFKYYVFLNRSSLK